MFKRLIWKLSRYKNVPGTQKYTEKFKKEVEQVCSKVAGISGMSEQTKRRDSNMVSFKMAWWNHVERHFLNRFPQQFSFLLVLVLVLLNAHRSLAGLELRSLSDLPARTQWCHSTRFVPNTCTLIGFLAAAEYVNLPALIENTECHATGSVYKWMQW